MKTKIILQLQFQDEVVRFYCETCEKCVCVVCTFQDHQGHDVSSFEDATEKFEDPIRKLAKQCKVKLQASEEAVGALLDFVCYLILILSNLIKAFVKRLLAWCSKALSEERSYSLWATR